MRRFKIQYILLILIGGMAMSCHSSHNKLETERKPARVKVENHGDGFRLSVNGEPFYIKGAGLEFGDIKSLAENGGNAFRTWRTENGKKSGKQVLDEAYQNGLMVCMGIEIARERHGFDYNDTAAVREQFERVKQEVLKYKDHPALLMWGIGNELNLNYSNMKVWDAVQDIAAMIHQLDPNHPTTTMLAGIGKKEVDYIKSHCPDLDILSIQIYGDILNLPKYLKESGWNGPYIISEWGPTGHWESPKTSWGRPIEPTSTEKARLLIERYQKIIARDTLKCLGSFVFLWGQKQERTPTWYGMFLESGEPTESVDAMYFLWNGEWPQFRAPGIKKFTLNHLNAEENVIIHSSQIVEAEAITEPRGSKKLKFIWEILSEVEKDKESLGGDLEPRPKTLFHQVNTSNKINIKMDFKPGEYRLFVYVVNEHGKAATANIPYLIIK